MEQQAILGTKNAKGSPTKGIRVGLVKIKTLRPWPEEELREATKHAAHIIVPEFNVIGWMAREIKATIPRSERVVAGPRVCGGMTMPPEIIVEEIKKTIGLRSGVLAGRGS
jgi:pyruvate ferredoxin oxidoreductase alpha subunit